MKNLNLITEIVEHITVTIATIVGAVIAISNHRKK